MSDDEKTIPVLDPDRNVIGSATVEERGDSLHVEGSVDLVKFGAWVPISQELLDDCRGFSIGEAIGDYLTYGQPRRHRNPLPTFLFFPRTQRLIDGALFVRSRLQETWSTLRHGLPEYQNDYE